jgi:hypothetical protein
MAELTTGTRIYFGEHYRIFQKLRVRFPDSPIKALPQTTQSSSTLLIPTTDSSGNRKLLIYSPNPGLQTSLREEKSELTPPGLQELQNTYELGQHIHAIAEVSSTNPKNDVPSLTSKAGISLSPYARQGSVKGRSFLVLYDNGLLVLGLKRPMDEAYEAMIPEETRKEAPARMKSK